MLETNRFKIDNKATDYDRAKQHFMHYFEIDIDLLQPEISQILINSINYGASAAIMNLINQLQVENGSNSTKEA